jgi:hypothetical protein
MDFGLAVTITPEVQGKSIIIHSLSGDLNFFFKNKDYGNDVKSYTIGVHCQNVPPGFEKFSKLPKPSYTKRKKIINPDGIPFTLEDSFEHSIKLDFETFKNASEIEAKKYLAQEIINSLDVIETMKSKIKDFDFLTFKTDLENYFKEKNLI